MFPPLSSLMLSKLSDAALKLLMFGLISQFVDHVASFNVLLYFKFGLTSNRLDYPTPTKKLSRNQSELRDLDRRFLLDDTLIEERKAMDDKISLKEEQEEFKAELKVMRDAAQWRRLQEQELGVMRIPISKTLFGLNWCGFARKSEALCVPERIGVKFGMLLYSGCGTSGFGSRTWLR
ncbi:hypothetical protein IFM89_030579 [Coptis chinensis]|uniref:Uncharacterized protein n=1 Tax=Coptis chinensis TaxID=261450 RepID=A0A835HPP9_9MAGN|nr:hypothetical protein IFM89_030579 [Coptis chinensis]